LWERSQEADGGTGAALDVGLGLPARRIDVPQSRKILADILAGVPDDEQARIAGANTARV